MDHAKHMATNQLNEYMWLSAVRQIFERILKTTKDKNWRKKIKTADTYMDKIIMERWNDLDPLEQKKVWRRIQSIKIKVYAYDDARVDRDDFDREMTIQQQDFFDLCDAAFLNCMACPQGELVKGCKRREMYHRLGLAVHGARENPEPGQCEFRFDDKQYAVTPQYLKCEKELIDQLP